MLGLFISADGWLSIHEGTGEVPTVTTIEPDGRGTRRYRRLAIDPLALEDEVQVLVTYEEIDSGARERARAIRSEGDAGA